MNPASPLRYPITNWYNRKWGNRKTPATSPQQRGGTAQESKNQNRILSPNNIKAEMRRGQSHWHTPAVDGPSRKPAMQMETLEVFSQSRNTKENSGNLSAVFKMSRDVASRTTPH